MHQKCLDLCSEDGLTGLERHEGEQLMTEFSTISLSFGV